MENTNLNKQSTPTPSTTANVAGTGTGIAQGHMNGARAGQKPDLSAQEDLSLDNPEKHMSKSDEDLAEYDSRKQNFGSDDFLADDSEEQPTSERDQKYAATLKALDKNEKENTDENLNTKH